MFYISPFGTFEGYVAGPTDLYNRGQNPLNFTGTDVTNESGGLRFFGVYDRYGNSEFKITSSKAFNFIPYSKLRIEFLVDNVMHYSQSHYQFVFRIYNASSIIVQGQLDGSLNNKYTIELNISSYSATSILQILFNTKVYSGGGDSDYTWDATQFNGWIYKVSVA